MEHTNSKYDEQEFFGMSVLDDRNFEVFGEILTIS
jgi:hypothetical protein